MSGRGIGGHHSPRSNTDVWLTPPHIIEALGPFDLDPCAAPAPRPWPTASEHWRPEDTPLMRAWHGRVWLNPPYGQRQIIFPWMARMADHGRGTALIFARTETDVWHNAVWPCANAVLFLKGRLQFHRPDGSLPTASDAGAPSALVAYGAYDTARLAGCGLPGAFVVLRPVVRAAA